MIKEYDQLVKLILIGSSGVGKSSVLMQFAQNKFTDNYLTTIGVDFRFKTIKHEGKNIKFQIWDTAGQERFRTITSAYYKGADGIIMVYDLTEPSSVDDIEQFWIPEANNYCDKNIKVLLLGNKSDVPRVVSSERIRKIVEKNNFKTEQVSAKTSEKIFQSIRDFGVQVAQEKAQKMQGGSSNINSSSNSANTPNNTSSNQNYTSSTSKSDAKTVQIGNNAKGVPNYQKKCC